METNNSERLIEFQELIGYYFNDISLLKQSLTTPRFGNEMNIPDYEILETIGDVVLKLILVMKKYKEGINDPGDLTKVKQQIENDKTFRKIAVNYFNLEKYIFKSQTQKIHGTRIFADIFEAICGAVYLDSNQDLKVVENKIVDKFYPEWHKIIKNSKIFNKNILLEFLQAYLKITPKIDPEFEKEGTDDKPSWIAKKPKILDNNGEIILLLTKHIENLKSKTATSKKEAEQDLYFKIHKKLRKKLNLSS
ncbi:MAG: ribonuclease III domain-containing protein [Candidatus Lokiarchaeota archaeon]